ncbi:MAG: DUF1405 domain-containing protein [Bacilli bacterium]
MDQRWPAVMGMVKKRKVLYIIYTLNIVGTLFGFAWYKGQLARTLWYFRPFVPDCPLSSLWFAIALSGFLWPPRRSLARRMLPFMAAVAVTWLSKYGLWGIFVLLWELARQQALPFEAWALLASHLGMVVEAVLLTGIVPLLRFSRGHLAAAGATLLLNDYVDYVYGVFPYLPTIDMLPFITVFTPLLSLAVLAAWWRATPAVLNSGSASGDDSV